VREAAADLEWFRRTTCVDIDDTHPLDRRLLEEKHLISPAFVRHGTHRLAMIANSSTFSILVNEEDHLRIQAIRQGLQLFKAWKSVSYLEQSFQEILDFAHSERYGYFTACPSNRGSGMRASVMLFLPALIWSRQIAPCLRQVSVSGYTVRGMYGEGSRSFGSLVQISKRIEARCHEQQRQELQHLKKACYALIAKERRVRFRMLASAEPFLRRQVSEVWNALVRTQPIEFRAGMRMVSVLRLATALQQEFHWDGERDIFLSNRLKRLTYLDQLAVRIQPAHILKYGIRTSQHTGMLKPESSWDQEILRAHMMQEALDVKTL
jgi:protein arginine kinase